jgi:hypothetical protein
MVIQSLRQGFRQNAVNPGAQELAFSRALAARQRAKPLVLIGVDINLFSLHAHHEHSYTLQYTSGSLGLQQAPALPWEPA